MDAKSRILEAVPCFWKHGVLCCEQVVMFWVKGVMRRVRKVILWKPGVAFSAKGVALLKQKVMFWVKGVVLWKQKTASGSGGRTLETKGHARGQVSYACNQRTASRRRRRVGTV